MEKNSIEETKRIIEKLISAMKSDRELFTEKTDKEIYTFFINALEFILSDYKRVLKENEESKDLIAHKNEYTKKLEKDLFENCSNYVISKQKVKDKIDELKIMNVDGEVFTTAVNFAILTLQELLEESEEK